MVLIMMIGFSPIAKISFIHVLISLAANLHWPLFQLDVKNAFLHGYYMRKFIWRIHLDLLLRGSIKAMSAS
jgi:hypothetical protein